MAPRAPKSTNVSVEPSELANALPVGNYSGVIMFQDVGDGSSTESRVALMQVSPNGPTWAVLPESGVLASGQTGGPFRPSAEVYSITNTGASPLPWSAFSEHDWLSLSPATGLLAPGTSTEVTVQVNENANRLGIGTNGTVITFVNDLNSWENMTRTWEVAVYPFVLRSSMTLSSNAEFAVTVQGVPG